MCCGVTPLTLQAGLCAAPQHSPAADPLHSNPSGPQEAHSTSHLPPAPQPQQLQDRRHRSCLMPSLEQSCCLLRVEVICALSSRLIKVMFKALYSSSGLHKLNSLPSATVLTHASEAEPYWEGEGLHAPVDAAFLPLHLLLLRHFPYPWQKGHCTTLKVCLSVYHHRCSIPLDRLLPQQIPGAVEAVNLF